MAYIVEPIVGDRRLQLGNEEFVRTLGFRTNWTKLRIGMRFTFNNTGASILNASLAFGLCEGSTATYFNNNTTGFWGTCPHGRSILTTYTYDAGGYYYGSTNAQFLTRIGNTTTPAAITIGGDVAYYLFGNHGTLYCDYEKNNAGLNKQTIWYNNNATHNYDHSQTEFFQAMEWEFTGGSPNTIPGARNYNGAWTAGYGGNINALDTLSISWNKSTPTIEFSDIMVLRYS